MRTLSFIFIIITFFILTACQQGITKYEEEIVILQDNLNVNIYILGENIEFNYPIDYKLISMFSEFELNDDGYNVLIINTDIEDIDMGFIENLDNITSEENIIIAFYNLDLYYEELKFNQLSLFENKDYSEHVIVVAKASYSEYRFNTLKYNENQNEESLEIMLLKMINDSIEFSYD